MVPCCPAALLPCTLLPCALLPCYPAAKRSRRPLLCAGRVIEDDFCNGRPEWEAVGAIMVRPDGDGVHVYEAMKLRLLNGSHSALAYVSYLAGHRLVCDAMEDPKVFGFVSAFLDEVL